MQVGCMFSSLVGDIDGMKNSPVNGPGTPRDDLPPVSGTGDMGAYNLAYQDNVSQISLWKKDLNWQRCSKKTMMWDIIPMF